MQEITQLQGNLRHLATLDSFLQQAPSSPMPTSSIALLFTLHPRRQTHLHQQTPPSILHHVANPTTHTLSIGIFILTKNSCARPLHAVKPNPSCILYNVGNLDKHFFSYGQSFSIANNPRSSSSCGKPVTSVVERSTSSLVYNLPYLLYSGLFTATCSSSYLEARKAYLTLTTYW